MNETLRPNQLDAIVLAGGESRRMGTSKALLAWGDTTVIGATLAILGPLFRRVVVVTRDRTTLPDLQFEVLEDGRAVHGPLAGLARGLSATEAPWCFLVGCDMPLLRPGVIRRMTEHLGGCQILAAYLEGYYQPLHCYYSRACLPQAEELLNQGVSSLRSLLSRCDVRSLTATDFLDIDPQLRSFKDIDTLEDYEAARNIS